MGNSLILCSGSLCDDVSDETRVHGARTATGRRADKQRVTINPFHTIYIEEPPHDDDNATSRMASSRFSSLSTHTV